MSKFIIQYNGSEVIVKLSKLSEAKVIIHDAEFIIRPQLVTHEAADQVVEFDEVRTIDMEEQEVVKHEVAIFI